MNIYIDAIVERLLNVRSRFISSNFILPFERIECFSISDGIYNYNQVKLQESKETGYAIFWLYKHEDCKLLTNPADIRLAANKDYNEMVYEAKVHLPPELADLSAKLVQDTRYFRDIHGGEYYHVELVEGVGFNLWEKGGSLEEVNFSFGDMDFPLLRADGKPIEVSASGITRMDKLLDELEPWAYRMLALPNKQK